MRILFAVLMATRAGAMLPGMRIPPPAGMRVYVRLTTSKGVSTGWFMGQQPRGDSFSFTAPVAMTLTALRVKVKKAGSAEGKGEAWRCASGGQAFSVSMPAEAARGRQANAAGTLRVKKGGTIVCSHTGKAKTKPFVDIVLSGN